jgi:hypothetical protein
MKSCLQVIIRDSLIPKLRSVYFNWFMGSMLLTSALSIIGIWIRVIIFSVEVVSNTLPVFAICPCGSQEAVIAMFGFFTPPYLGKLLKRRSPRLDYLAPFFPLSLLG